jgi:peptide/nickel transport system permease protein
VTVQFYRYVSGVLQGDLGRSIATRRPVMQDLRRYFPATAELAVLGMLLYVVIAVPMGVLAALSRGKWIDFVVRFATVLALAVPPFVLAMLLQILLGRSLGWFPLDGRMPIGASVNTVTGFVTIDTLLAGDFAGFATALRHLALPVVAIAAGRLAVATRFMRAGLLEVLGTDYVRTALAKGVGPATVVWKHAMKNAVLPLVTVLGLQFGYLLGGIVFIEVIFSWPGLGRYMVDAIFAFDFPAVIGATLLLGTVYVVVNAFVDVLYNYIDPRIGS